MMKSLRAVVLTAFAASFLLLAQSLTSVSGTVTDNTDSVIVGAEVEILNLDNGTRRATRTDTSGVYSFPQIQPGNYRLIVKQTGFSTATVDNIRLLVNTPATVAVKLEVGQITETVSVSAEAIQVNTTDATVGNTFGEKPILQLPFEGRNVVGLLSLQPGVTFAGENLTTSYRGGNVNGGKSDQANVTLDGVDVNDQQNRDPFTSVLRVTLDSVQEFRVVTTNANADQGRSSGAQIALVTKSGTNDLHGSVYWFLRNKATNANSFFNNVNDVPLAKLNRNIGGASAGGPIIKNRLFLFGNYEARRDRREDSVLRTVPTATMRSGIASYVRTDRTIAQVTPQMMLASYGRGPNAEALRTLQRYPLPNDSSVGDGINFTGFRFNAPVAVDLNTYIARLDYVLDSGNKHNLFVRGNLQDDTIGSAPQFPGLPPNSQTLNGTKGFAVGLNSVVTPQLINTFRYGLTRVSFENSGLFLAPFVSFRALDNVVGVTRPFIRKTPVHTIADDVSWSKGAHEIKGGFVTRLIRNSRFNYGNSYHGATTNASWLTSSGAGLNTPFPDMLSTGRVAYRDSATAILGLVTQVSAQYNYNKDGTAMAQGDPVARQFNAEEYEFYVQDTWRLHRKLTLTYGMRYMLMPPIYEANGIQTISQQPLGEWFNDRVNAAYNGHSQDKVVNPVTYILKEQPGGRDLYPFHKDNWAPRLAIAYSPDSKTAIRAGWGMFYDVMGSGLITNYDASAFGLSTSLTNPSAVQTIASAPGFTGVSNIPGSLLQPAPKGGFPATAPNIFAIINSLDDQLKAPYTMNMNFSLSREFGRGFFAQIGYVGRLSRRSLISEDIAAPLNVRDPASGQTYFQAATDLALLARKDTPINQVQPVAFWENVFPSAAGGGRTATQNVYDAFAANAPDYSYALYGMDLFCDPGCAKTGPYTFFNRQYSYLRVLKSIGYGNYHGMQMTMRQRWNNGDQVEFNYTWSKSLDMGSRPEVSTSSDAVIINPYSRRQFRAASDYDARHMWNANFIYGLPFGKNAKFASGANGFVDALIGGWQFSGLYRHSTGLPGSVGNGRFWPTNWNITGYATPVDTWEDGTNKNAPAPPGGSSGANLFQDPGEAVDSFDYTLPGQSGSRNILRGDGNFNIDLGLAKRFVMPYAESHSVQFRWEVFNVTNSVRFDPLSASISLGDIGSFGRYTDTLTLPRVMQFALRYEF